MKSSMLILIFLFSLQSLFAQEFAVIMDDDGYTNVRSENNTSSRVIDKLKNGHLVCVMSPEGNWLNIDYSTNKTESKVGYVYKDRIQRIADYSEISMVENMENEIRFSNKTIEVQVVKSLFDKTKHSFEYANDYPDLILTIDGKEFWGTDGYLPTTEYKSIVIKYNNATIHLPKEALENLYEPNLTSTTVNFDKKNNALYISSLNSDGAGGYMVIWKIVKGKYKERFVAYGF